MSTDEYNKRVQQTNKLVASLRKDIKYRQEQQRRNEATYSIDAEIKGSFLQLNEIINKLSELISSYKASPKDYGLSNKEVEIRSRQYDKFKSQQDGLKRTYDSYFEKKNRDNLMGDGNSLPNTAQQKHNTQAMTAAQLHDLKKKQELEQQEAIDGLIDTVKNIKTGGKAIHQELNEQDVMLNVLDEGIDDNTKNIGRVRKNMVKLLDESSNCCLIVVIVLEIVAVVCILVLWQ